MTALLERASLLRSRRASLLAGAALALVAAVAAPSTELLPGPHGPARTALSALVLLGAFAAGRARPLHALYGLVALTVLEGAIRKWIVNEITVFLAKDFLLLGLYAAVLPRLSLSEWRRPWWLVAPLAGIVVLALVHLPRSDSLSQAAIGLRSYILYVPLLWVAPYLISGRKRALGLLGLVLGLAAGEAVLATIQALSGPGVLNKLVSGALQGMITLQSKAYIRPSGTFMQVGVLSAFLFFGLLVAFALIAVHRRGRLLRASFAAVVFISWGIVYTSARSLLGSALLAFGALTLWLLWQRRLVSLVAVPASFALGILLLFNVIPAVRDAGDSLVGWYKHRGYEKVNVTVSAGQTVEVRLDPKLKVKLEAALSAVGRPAGGSTPVPTTPAATTPAPTTPAETTPAATTPAPAGTPKEVTVRGIDLKGAEVVVVVTLSERGAAKVVVSRQVDTIPALDEQGHIVDIEVSKANEISPVGGFLGRAADFNKAGGTSGIWSGRIRPQFELISHQRLVGHGPGTMTLGSEYANPSGQFQGESMYSKAAWELGLPGLALFLWYLAALLVLTARGIVRAEEWQRAVAVVGLGATALLPLWYVLTFALDFPIVGILFGLFAGCAVAYGSGSAPRRA